MAILSTKLLGKVAGKIERNERLDEPADKLAEAANKALSAPWLVNLLSGSVAGHPLHPLFIALPIGSWSTALALDLLGDDDAARKSIGIGLVTTIPTVVTGVSDWRYTLKAERRVGLVHATSNVLAIAAYAGSWVARKADRRGLGVGLSLVGMGFVSYSGWLGGHLSYALGVGVDTTAFQHSQAEWTSVGWAEDVTVGETTLGDANGVPVVLTRTRTGDVVVLADRCTHRGGPLHEGGIVDGCLACPWHGSRFDLDGAVAQGPANRPQQSYEVEVRDGQVYARISDEPRAYRTNPVGV